jgi:Meiotically up-regulated gene 113
LTAEDSLTTAAAASAGISKRHTYLIGAEGSHLVKIGYAVDPKKRLAMLQTGQPLTLSLLWSCHGDHEQALHRRFAEHRVRGEWFDLTPLGDPVQAVQAAVEEILIQSDGRDRSTAMPAELDEALRTVEQFIHLMATERPLVALDVIGRLEKLIEAPTAGTAARQLGATWTEIGAAVRTTRQAAFQRFGRHLSQAAGLLDQNPERTVHD